MTTQHTQGRLVDDERGHGVITGEQRQTIATANKPADARRLVAAWNACEGISTESLEKYAQRLEHPFKDLFLAMEESERELMDKCDELLKALKRIEGASMSMYATRSSMMEDCRYIARAAIAKVEGGAV